MYIFSEIVSLFDTLASSTYSLVSVTGKLNSMCSQTLFLLA